MGNLKRNDTNELTKQTVRGGSHSLREPKLLTVAGGEGWGGEGSQGVWGGHVHTAVFKMDNCWANTLRKPDWKETRAPQCSSQHCLS